VKESRAFASEGREHLIVPRMLALAVAPTLLNPTVVVTNTPDRTRDH
jgi:hypothetical protein